MKQLITRIDDDLHARLKEVANSEARSLNDLVTETLARALRDSATHRTLRDRARATGRLLEIDPPPQAPGLDAVEELTRGMGRAASEALEADRGDR